MKSIAKLKDQARKHEQREDWKAAIEAYQKVLETEQGEAELELELGLFNRIGDLYLRLGETDNAVSYYEQASEKYAEAGFFNNAIALCNKALRHRPNRAQIYLRLSRLSAEQGFTTDARRWILEYAARQVKTGRVDSALEGLADFVESSEDPDVREFLAQQLATQGRKDEAAAHFARAYAERMARGETEAAGKAAERARALDPSIDLSGVAAPRRHAAGLEDAGEDDGLAGLETGPGSIDGASLEVEEMAGFETSYSERKPEASPDDLEDGVGLGGLETFGTDAGDELGQADEDAGVGPGLDDEDVEPLPLMEDEAEPLPMLSIEGPDEELAPIEEEPEQAEEPEVPWQPEELEEVEEVEE
ncbi:MAG: tetratricopeptide repeat protein, partial [Gemmatimonadetes bacterium]|nr:tetratricopeptide repeat protein [Gemmatimonadota bacterium]